MIQHEYIDFYVLGLYLYLPYSYIFHFLIKWNIIFFFLRWGRWSVLFIFKKQLNERWYINVVDIKQADLMAFWRCFWPMSLEFQNFVSKSIQYINILKDLESIFLKLAKQISKHVTLKKNKKISPVPKCRILSKI